jgi:hypothetical protein
LTVLVKIYMLTCSGFELLDSVYSFQSEGSKPLKALLAVMKHDESLLIEGKPRGPLEVFENVLR